MEEKMNKIELEKIKVNAIENHIPIIMDETLEVIAKYLLEIKPKRILEIGSAVGYSAMCFSEYLDEDGIIDTIEKDEERYNQAVENIKNCEIDKNINLIFGDAVEEIEKLKNNKYDIIFIDANKGKYPYYLEKAIPMLNVGGYIFADNVLYKGYVLSDYNKHKQRTAVTHLRQYLGDVSSNDKLETTLLEVGDGLCISKKVKE